MAEPGVPDLNSMTLTDVNRTRKRLGGTLVMDYQHENGEIGLMNFLSLQRHASHQQGADDRP